jgi:hypothetical protein
VEPVRRNRLRTPSPLAVLAAQVEALRGRLARPYGPTRMIFDVDRINLPGAGARIGRCGWEFSGRRPGAGDPWEAARERAELRSIHLPIAFLRAAGAVLEAIWSRCPPDRMDPPRIRSFHADVHKPITLIGLLDSCGGPHRHESTGARRCAGSGGVGFPGSGPWLPLSPDVESLMLPVTLTCHHLSRCRSRGNSAAPRRASCRGS